MSLSSGAFLCAGEGGFDIGLCSTAEARLRIYVIASNSEQSDVEIQLAASGQCLGTRETPAPGVRVVALPCSLALWRLDAGSYRLSIGGLCVRSDYVSGSGTTVPARLAACETDDRRQEWALAEEM